MEHNSTACRQREVGGERWGEFEEAEADKKGAVYLTCFTPLQLSLAHSTPCIPSVGPGSSHSSTRKHPCDPCLQLNKEG